MLALSDDDDGLPRNCSRDTDKLISATSRTLLIVIAVIGGCCRMLSTLSHVSYLPTYKHPLGILRSLRRRPSDCLVLFHCKLFSHWS